MVGRIEYSYEELLIKIREVIQERFGSLAKFTASEEYRDMGYSPKQAQNFYTYLSLPKEGTKKKTKSFVTIQKLFKILLGTELKSEMVVTRTMTLFTEKG